MDKQSTVLLVDDHAVFRKGLRLLLEAEPDLRVVGEAGDGQEAIDLARKLSPDVVVMDITMPNLNGIEATRHIISASPNAKVMALSIHSGKRFVEDMLRAGAAGYVLKDSAPEELVNGIRTVTRGEVYLSPAIVGVVVSQYVNVLARGDTSAGSTGLTAREREIVRLIAEGNSSKQIASVLRVEVKTVESTRRRIMKKLDVSSVAELTEVARQGGLFEPAGKHAPVGGAASLPLMATKLHRPAVAADIFARVRLLGQLNEGVQQPLTLISAPAGYGKSTLASRWLDACACPGVWLSLDEDDNDLRTFLSYFLAAIQTAFPEFGQATGGLLAAPNLPPGSVLTRHLLNDLDQIDKPFILVLDDYHRIHETAVDDVLTELLQHPPRAMHLALLTRRDPALPISTLRARGQVTEIGVRELRFTVAETAAFLQNILRATVKDTTAAILEKKTEGWVTGLRLAALSLRSREDLDRLAKSLQGSSRYIADYLIVEVVSRQPPEIAQYLMETSILGRFCASLCEAVHASHEDREKGKISGADFIAWLERANLFVIPLDAENDWFRYHHLFQQLLRNQWEGRLRPDDISTLHARASAWSAANGLIDEAIRHSLAADDVIGAAQLVEQNRQAMLNNDRWYVLERWLSMFPEASIRQRPELLMAHVWVLYHHFAIAAIPSVIDTVESLLGDAPIAPALRGEIDFFRGYVLYFQNQGAKSLKYLQDALKRVPETYHEIRGQIEILHGLASQMQGRKEEAVGTLNDLLYNHRLPETIQKTRLLVTLVYIHIVAGELTEALAANQQLYNFSAKHGYTYADVWSVYLKGLIHYYRNDGEEAIRCFRQALEQKYLLHARAAVDSMVGLALLCQTERQSDEASATIRLLREYVDHLNDLAYSTIARSCEARLSIMQGEPESAVGWFRTNAPPAENMVWWLEIPAVTHCRVLLAEGSDRSLKECEAKLRELLQLNQDNHNTCHMIQIMVLLALACEKQERADEALTFLERAVTLAKPGGWIRPFIESGPSMADLLKRLAAKGVAEDYIDTLLDAIEREESTAVPDTARHPEVEPMPEAAERLLTQREVEILSRVAEGLSNKEIAAKLFLSTETIKKHLYNAYQKLDADSRVTALAKARALGILPRS